MKRKIDVRIFCAVLFVLAVVLRCLPHDYNMSAIGALGLFVGYYWSASFGILFAVAAMALSDLLGHLAGIPSMGAYDWRLMIAVYAAMGMSGLVGRAVAQPVRGKRLPLWISVAGGAVMATLAFFLLSNFAVWVNPMSGYSRSWNGITECYVAAIPFVRNTLASNLVFSTAFFGVWALLQQPASVTDPVTIRKPHD